MNRSELLCGHQGVRTSATLHREIAVLALLCMLCASTTAAAQPAAQPPDRLWGLGTAIGGGYGDLSGVARCPRPGGSSEDGVGYCWPAVLFPPPYVLYPTLELRFFLRRGHSLDVSIPVADALVFAASHIFAFATDVFYSFNLGQGRVRAVLGPGLGFSVAAGTLVNEQEQLALGAVRVPALAGVEFLSKRRRFGFQIRARPWIQVGSGRVGAESTTGVGGGIFGELAFIGYGTRAAR